MATAKVNLQNIHDMKTTHDITKKTVGKVSECLNGVLANEYALFTKTLNYHWNITGPQFHSLHLFLEGQYQQLLKVTDEVAERIRILQQHPLSTVKELRDEMDIEESVDTSAQTEEMLRDLLKGHMRVQSQIQEGLDMAELKEDAGTEDLLVSLLRKHEKMSWMIRAHFDQ
ncbi:DNA starvation/stationary phase protection protein [Candidatus Kaiserbacteria bacterium CG10_big_fil_rev_8_21_14_0_10_44_10]|uniref:DNA starvation/stationary phase protection protein n=1 Tax=Candidatus Kaiserbacteria bacterium CG10_big_fil_rev_8_21_14_0_10_44_10 TaxID=1974606 RepID=A0A2H0UI64_9BACT|nr:MAG: DNA starvation/stationary phase protection protein [Candidatus Kaiserbacteria bacterium CG10_big_fil_rev_8_21_14_0_10_44_10]